MEEMTRLKGEKWLREGKSRALRAVQTRKRVALRRVSLDFFRRSRYLFFCPSTII